EVCVYNAIADLKNTVLVFAELCHGCGACSYLCPEGAISEVGREIGLVEVGYSGGIQFVEGRLNVGEALAPPVIRNVKQHIDPETTVIIDVSPGTSCPVVESVKGSDFCLLVTEPTPFGLNDLVLATEVVRKLDIPCGVVINRAGIGDNKVEEYCLKEGIPVLLTIPLDTQIAHNYSKGTTLVEGMPQWHGHFVELFDKVKERVNGRLSSKQGGL
ncbi:4Fe-4S binding protein, partial [Chloroflexota bacterium]